MSTSAVILGATGYVGGELLRLLAQHPTFGVAAAVSGSKAGTPVAETFPHLAHCGGPGEFASPGSWVETLDTGSDVALFSAAPHGASAAIVADAFEAADRRNLNLRVVDSSADFRYSTDDAYSAVYGSGHGAPQLLPKFISAVPEHVEGAPADNVGHPGCFATAVLLAAMPLAAEGLVEEEVFVTGITGSTGSGRTPAAGTHHPERHSNLYAYKPLVHRHVPEVEGLIANRCDKNVRVNFVPHSGPFARGIHVTLQARLAADADTDSVRSAISRFYENAEFVNVVDGTPRLKNVVGSNHCHLGASVAGDRVVVMSVIDNLVKGAAGGAVQWMNRLWSLPDGSGLGNAAPAWT